MAIRKVISKEISIKGSEYVGHRAEVWIDDDGTKLRVGDGVTPGGINVVDGLTNNGNSVVLGSDGVLTIPGNVSLPNSTLISGNSVIVGENASSPYWYATLNGTSLPAATVATATAPSSAPPIVTLTGTQPPEDRTRVLIVGAAGMTGLNDYWYTKATGNPNEYELWDNYDLDSYTDLSGEDAYENDSASLSYYSYQSTTTGVAHDANGNVFTAGWTDSEYGTDRAFVAKYSSTGVLLWQKIFEDDQNLSGWGMAVDSSGNAFAVVNDDERIHIVKLNGETGALIWQNAITSPSGEYGYYCELASDGHVVIGGRITNPDDGTDDFLVAKVSSTDGTLIWSKKLGYSFDQEAYGVACDPRGPIVVVGYTEMDSSQDQILVARYESDGTMIWQKTIPNFDSDYQIYGVDAAIDSSGNIYISASCNSSGGSAAVILKLNNAGTVQWSRVIGPGPCETIGLSIAVDSNDLVYVMAATGQETQDIPQFDFVLGCYNGEGAVQWQRYWGSKNAWEAGTMFNPAAGQLISLHGDYMAVGGWQWVVNDDGYPFGNGAAFVAQLPKDGSLISIGQWTMRLSRFAGQFVYMTSYDAEMLSTDNPLVQSSATFAINSAMMTSMLTTDWPTVEQQWTFDQDGSTTVPGSINLDNTAWAEDIWNGPEVYFVKHNGGDEIDQVGPDLAITRAWNGGIYNSDEEEDYQNYYSPEGTEWNSDGWSDLSNVKTRDYDNWQTIVYPPNSIAGRELVMHDTINDKYYTVKFLSWQPNSMGGGFSYVRREINTEAYFTKTSYGSEVDNIGIGLSITRGENGIIYNPAAGENSADNDYSPLNTLWNGDGWGNLANLEGRQWLSFYYIMGGENIGKRVLGREWIMWDTTNNEYYAIEFTAWQSGNNGGAFSYIRRKINKTRITTGVVFPDGTQQVTAYNESAAGVLPQKKYDASDDRWINIDDVGKHILVTNSGTELRLPDATDQPWVIGATITIVNRSGGTIYLYKDNYNENGTIYGAGTADSSTGWQIPDSGGGNICTLICIEMYGYDDPTVNWMLSGPGIAVD
jgi:hypothetical protein